jgi:hypothetical protein
MSPNQERMGMMGYMLACSAEPLVNRKEESLMGKPLGGETRVCRLDASPNTQ